MVFGYCVHYKLQCYCCGKPEGKCHYSPELGIHASPISGCHVMLPKKTLPPKVNAEALVSGLSRELKHGIIRFEEFSEDVQKTEHI